MTHKIPYQSVMSLTAKLTAARKQNRLLLLEK